jgi:DNA-binding MarR family transcriptional regulator
MTHLMTPTLSSGTGTYVIAKRGKATSSAGEYRIQIGDIRRKKGGRVKSAKSIESAVYAHIQAVRALGKTHINTAEIAEALGLPLSAVARTITALRQKGVKVRQRA